MLIATGLKWEREREREYVYLMEFNGLSFSHFLRDKNNFKEADKKCFS